MTNLTSLASWKADSVRREDGRVIGLVRCFGAAAVSPCGRIRLNVDRSLMTHRRRFAPQARCMPRADQWVRDWRRQRCRRRPWVAPVMVGVLLAAAFLALAMVQP